MKERIEILDGSTAEDEVHARELRTSNPKVERFCFTYAADSSEYGYISPNGHGEFVSFNAYDSREGELLAEIERLNARVAELEAERNRLEENTHPIEFSRAKNVEIVRLRAALMEHAECCTMSAHASEALAVQNDAGTAIVDSGTGAELNPTKKQLENLAWHVAARAAIGGAQKNLLVEPCEASGRRPADETSEVQK